jgi:hypothetical protein
MVERIFRAVDRFGAEMEFELRTPTLVVENEGERQYRIAYTKALADGVYPRNKLREVMRGHGIWTDEDDKAMREEVAHLAILQIELERAQNKGDDNECLAKAKDMRKHRTRMWELFMIQQSVYMNSSEGIAELIKAEAIMAACVMIKATNQRYWPNYSEFVKERDDSTKSTVYIKSIEVQNELLLAARDMIEDTYSENRYLKDAKQAMIDRDIDEQVAKELETRKQKALEAADGTEVGNKTNQTP